MSSAQPSATEIRLHVENIGGIGETDVTLSPGVTVLSGRNATNRTSFLQALMAVLGSESDAVSLKGDADEGSVEAQFGGETHTRRLARTNGEVVRRGDPYLDAPELADLFAFLLESNEARRTVERGEDLRELIMRPVDTAEIEARIRDRRSERNRLEAEIEELEALEKRLPELEAERRQLREEIDEREAELEALHEEIAAADASIEERRAKRSALEERLEELQDAQSRLQEVEFRLDRERESIEALETQLDELSETEAELEGKPGGDLDELDERLADLRERKAGLDDEINELQRLVQFNEELLADDDAALHGVLGTDGEGVTDQLLAEEERVQCWTCGSSVDRGQVRGTVERLRDYRRRLHEERTDVQAEIESLTDRRSEIAEREQRRDDLERRRRQAETELERRRERVEELEERRAELATEVEELDAAVADEGDVADSELLELHREANQLELELEREREELAEVESEVERVEGKIADLPDLRAQVDRVGEELVDLRTRVEQIETRAVEQFNEQMETVLSLLGYENLDRIWIERTGTDREQSTFELHVVRSSESGTTYEDEFAHLSESEREITGLVFALAGYLVHDVHEVVPFILLDSLEAVDADRIARLVDYFGEHADYLVVALLDEDAQALDDDYERVTDI